MIMRNLRHMRVLVAVADTGSVTLAANLCNVSQPAVTQSISKLETDTGGPLFDRTRQGFFLTQRGEVLTDRVQRALAQLDPALAGIAPRLLVTARMSQLNALVAVTEVENFTLAARRLGLAQPTVHRAIAQLEHAAGRVLFERSAFGLVASRQTKALAMAARLAFAELQQAEADLAELGGKEAGRIVVGALPMARSVLLPRALIEYRKHRPKQAISVIDGPYDELLSGLRRGEIDFILGALRDPIPIGDIIQEPLFDDRLVFLCGNHHPLKTQKGLTRAELRDCAWVVPRQGTPTRTQFESFFAKTGQPQSIVEAGSILLMREILSGSDHLGCISRMQAAAEISKSLLSVIPFEAGWKGRPIGLTYRASWAPTVAQSLLVTLLRESVSRHLE